VTDWCGHQLFVLSGLAWAAGVLRALVLGFGLRNLIAPGVPTSKPSPKWMFSGEILRQINPSLQIRTLHDKMGSCSARTA
jgi:hypothetical protein